jgi:hypothetical protein
MTPEINSVWARIQAHQRETFHQKRGKAFTYSVYGNAIQLHTTEWQIPKNHVEHALERVPLQNTVSVKHLYGPSYLYAILMDPRIRGASW